MEMGQKSYGLEKRIKIIHKNRDYAAKEPLKIGRGYVGPKITLNVMIAITDLNFMLMLNTPAT